MMATVKSDPSPAPTPLNPERHEWINYDRYFSRTFDIEFYNFFGTGGHDPHFLLVHLSEVGDIANLRVGLHPLELVRHIQVGPPLPKVGEGGARVLRKKTLFLL